MKRIFKTPKSKLLDTGVKTNFIRTNSNVFRVHVETPYLFDKVTHMVYENIVDPNF